RAPFELLLGTDAEAGQWWRQDTSAGPVLVRGPYLVRSAQVRGNALALTGDTSGAGDLDVVAPPGVRSITWNGGPVAVSPAPDGTWHGRLNDAPESVRLPALTGWRTQNGAPEAAVDFDDSSWTPASHLTALHPSLAGSVPVLATDEYGFHHGDVWYRGRFPASGKETAVTLNAATGNQGVYAAWLNGV